MYTLKLNRVCSFPIASEGNGNYSGASSITERVADGTSGWLLLIKHLADPIGILPLLIQLLDLYRRGQPRVVLQAADGPAL